ncbi:MAG: response regulator [Bacteroidota bacterium]
MKRTSRSVLLIDDDRATNFFNQHVVRRHGHFDKIFVVESGLQALDFLLDSNHEKPSLILLDINMPAMNGWEFTEAFRKLDISIRQGIKLVILTTSSNPDDYERSLKNEVVDDYINKPLSPSILNEMVTEHFAHEAVPDNP